ncbi:MAG: DUF1508 domain-containing protein [Candidatus Rokuibacteriota bacterium]
MSEYEIREAKDSTGEVVGYYVCLVASNGEVLSTSELYTRRESAVRAVGDAQAAAADAADRAD